MDFGRNVRLDLIKTKVKLLKDPLVFMQQKSNLINVSYVFVLLFFYILIKTR